MAPKISLTWEQQQQHHQQARTLIAPSAVHMLLLTSPLLSSPCINGWISQLTADLLQGHLLVQLRSLFLLKQSMHRLLNWSAHRSTTAGPLAGPAAGPSQNASDDADNASPAAAPESIMGGTYDGDLHFNPVLESHQDPCVKAGTQPS